MVPIIWYLVNDRIAFGEDQGGIIGMHGSTLDGSIPHIADVVFRISLCSVYMALSTVSI